MLQFIKRLFHLIRSKAHADIHARLDQIKTRLDQIYAYAYIITDDNSNKTKSISYNVHSLEHHLAALPVWRNIGLPPLSGRRVEIITKSNYLPSCVEFVKSEMRNIVQKVILLDTESLSQFQEVLHLKGTNWEADVQVISINTMIYNPCNDILFYQPELSYTEKLPDIYFERCVEQCSCQSLMANHINFAGVWWANQPFHEDFDKHYFLADYFKANRELLSIAYSKIHDVESKNIFAAAVKAKITGNYTYMPFSNFLIYNHPKCLVREGDIVIDAGVSGSIHGPTHMFLDLIGKEGRVFGFEPSNIEFKLAQEKLGNIPNYRLLPFGLLDRECKVRFEQIHSGGSRVVDESREDECLQLVEMKTLDYAFHEYQINKVDFIKMDIEGSELLALHGAQHILRKFKPNLAISIYHRPEDLYSIIIFLNKLNLGYRYYLGHHSPYFWETVVYATARPEED